MKYNYIFVYKLISVQVEKNPILFAMYIVIV
jgi:hypothetical protein